MGGLPHWSKLNNVKWLSTSRFNNFTTRRKNRSSSTCSLNICNQRLQFRIALSIRRTLYKLIFGLNLTSLDKFDIKLFLSNPMYIIQLQTSNIDTRLNRVNFVILLFESSTKALAQSSSDVSIRLTYMIHKQCCHSLLILREGSNINIRRGWRWRLWVKRASRLLRTRGLFNCHRLRR